MNLREVRTPMHKNASSLRDTVWYARTINCTLSTQVVAVVLGLQFRNTRRGRYLGRK